MILLLVGFLLREIITYFKIPFPDIFFLLPALGNLGLLLIVLEATLSIKLNREHGKLLFRLWAWPWPVLLSCHFCWLWLSGQPILKSASENFF